MLSPKTRDKTGMSTHSLSNIAPEVLARASGKEKRQEKKRKGKKGISIGKEEAKVSPFADDMSLYMKIQGLY